MLAICRYIVVLSLLPVVASCSTGWRFEDGLSRFRSIDQDKILTCENSTVSAGQLYGELQRTIGDYFLSDEQIRQEAEIIDLERVTLVTFLNADGKKYLAYLFGYARPEKKDYMLHGGVYVVVEACSRKIIGAGDYEL